MRLKLTLVIIGLFLILFSSCESLVTQQEEEVGEIEMVQHPITYEEKADTSDVISVAKTTEEKIGYPYYCLISTLNPEDNQWAYTYRQYEIKLPNGLMKQIKQEQLSPRWGTFTVASKGAHNRHEADRYGGGGILRMAHCKLPALPQAQKAIESFIQRFD